MNQINKITSLMLSLLTAFSVVSTALPTTADAATAELALSHTQDRSYNFRTDYSLTGNPADDIVNVAKAQIGLTTAEAGYSEDWCADFVTDCARLTGMSESIIPYNYSLRAGCRFLYYYIMDYCGGTVIEDENDVMSGDLVFYYCPYSDFWLHTAIVESTEHYIDGDITTKRGSVETVYSDFNYKFGCYMHDFYSDTTLTGHVKRIYVRPNYGRAPEKLYTDTNPDTYYPPTRELSYKSPIPSCGFDVSWVQAVLRMMGYLNTVNGVYTEQTKDAVKRFQSEKGLWANGKVDSTTSEALQQKLKELRKPICDRFDIDETCYPYEGQLHFTLQAHNYNIMTLIISDTENNIVFTSDNITHNYSLDADILGKGSYRAQCILTNSYGSISSQELAFSIKDPPPGSPVVTANVGTKFSPTELKWNITDNTTYYDIFVLDSNGGVYTKKEGLSANTLSILLPAGEYSAYAISENETEHTVGDTVTFNVNEASPFNLGNGFYAKLSFDGMYTESYNNTLTLSATSDKLSHKWHFVRQPNNSYTITNCKTNKALSIGNGGSVVLANQTETILQRWFIAQSADNILLIPSYDEKKVLTFNENQAIIRSSCDCSIEELSLELIAEPHRYLLTEITVPTSGCDGYAKYVCEVTGEEKTAAIKYDTPDTADTPDSPDTFVRTVGDLNKDGKITTADSMMLLRSIIGLGHKPDNVECILHDVNTDGRISSADSLYILQYVLKIYNDSIVGQKVTIHK